MPKETFHRLSKAKKDKLLNACFEEFAKHNYQEASITRIVKNLGIAKGSIYQYFENKKDLYLYLIEHASTMRLTGLETFFDPEKEDFFEQIVENFSRKIEFDLQNPILSGFLYNVLQEHNTPELGEMDLNIKKWLHSMVLEIIRKYQSAGQISKHIDAKLAAFVIVQLQIGVFDYLRMQYQIDFAENIKQNKPVFSIPREEILSVVNGISNLLKYGFKNFGHDND